MAAEEVYQKILEHLKEEGPLNTFRLARNLNLDRYRLLNFIEKLEEVGAVEVQYGLVRFLKFAVEKKEVVKKPAEIKKTVFKPKRKHKVKKVKKVKETPPHFLQHLKAENKKLAEKLLKLESKVKELEQKPVPSPKIITKTIVKKVPVPSAPVPPSPSKRRKRKTKPKKKAEEKTKTKKAGKKPKKFKFPKFGFLKNIKQLKRPEFAKK
ncbi:hypothetical protein AUJ69_02405 [Candidatus Woesearchaeota archaeon CG1_02_47_18]|nr:MAG: hypothetical protein AUJ69_02405 [Candidatus Woesearchaeota archaeon CG1_02_47_18]